MAGHFTLLAHSFFDSSIRRESAETRIVFLAMISKCDLQGIVRATDDAIAAHACVSLDATRAALERLNSPDPKSTTPDEEGRRIVEIGPNQWRVVNFTRYWNREKQPERRAYKTEKQREYRQRSDGPRGPHGPRGQNGPTGEDRRMREEEEPLLSDASGTRTKKKALFPEDSIQVELSSLLLNRIMLRNPNHKQPDIQDWAKDIDLMIRRDGREAGDIRRVIEWATSAVTPSSNGFYWAKVILSPASLRRNFDRLVMESLQSKTIVPFDKNRGSDADIREYFGNS
jgi:hypothetical protein